jgi:hypothetical protein
MALRNQVLPLVFKSYPARADGVDEFAGGPADVLL